MMASNQGNRCRRAATVSVALLAALGLVAGACSDGDDSTASDSTAPNDSSTVATTIVATTSTTDSGATTTTTTGAETTTTEPTETTLPGEEIELFIDPGDVLGVVGVADDDELNVRAAPGTDQDIVTTAAPTADDLVGTGRERSLPSSIWYEVTVGGVTGWVSSAFVAFIGGTDDATAEYLASGDRPSAETMTDLGRIVAEDFASTDPRSDIVQTVAPTVGDLGEVTYDVIGIGDDAQIGYRLHIFAIEDENGETFTLRTIERTALCGRGLSGELCS
ncbi:MAG: SH3 domain-containing protein [Acidimicrobiales bacterium]